jgi:hypothetical protein
MSENIILQELYKNEMELIHKLVATRNAIVGFGGNINSLLLDDKNDSKEISIKKEEKKIIEDIKKGIIKTINISEHDYSKKWKWENKISYALMILHHADIDQLTDFIMEAEPYLNKETVRNSISVRTSLMKKEKLLNFMLSAKKNRKHRHIYSLK